MYGVWPNQKVKFKKERIKPFSPEKKKEEERKKIESFQTPFENCLKKDIQAENISWQLSDELGK